LPLLNADVILRAIMVHDNHEEDGVDFTADAARVD
jgi:hypothetical protein